MSEGALLVINTKLASAGEKKTDSGREREKLKWSRLRVARRLLRGLDENMKNWHATAKCFYVPIAYAVEHWKRGEEKAFFKSVVICGRRSACPVCNAKISAWDRDELQEGMTKIFSMGWYVYMVTYTVRHNKFMRCAETLSKLNEALRRVKSGRKWQELKARYGFEGSITALENTFSFENGHHPHKHVLEVSSKYLTDAELQQMRDEIAEMYVGHLAKIGASAVYEIAVDVKRGSDYVAEYVSKFGHEPEVRHSGVSYEMANYSGKTKGVEHGHYSMFQLLDLAGVGNVEAGEAYLDYVEAFKGKAMLTWSGTKNNSLRKKLGMSSDTSDEDKAKVEGDEPVIFALYQSKRGWLKVRDIPHVILDTSLGLNFDKFKEIALDYGVEVESPYLLSDEEWKRAGLEVVKHANA